MTLALEELREPGLTMMERVLARDSLASTWPLVFDERFPGRVLGLRAEGEVRSACTTLVRDFLSDGARVRGGLIGSVVTEPAWRGRGLATRLLIEAEAALARQGCAFVLLWADDPEFYARRGYGPIGRELDVLVEREVAARLPEPRGLRALRAEDAPAIHGLYARHGTRVDRTPEETRALLACPRMRTLVLERAGELVAYACLGRGPDLGHALHEWGGGDADVLALVRAQLEARAREHAGDELVLMAPASARGLCAALARHGAPARHGMLGLGRLLDRDAALALLRERLASRGTAELVQRNDARVFRLSGPRGEGFLDDEGALALLFGVEDVREPVACLLADLGLEGVRLPLDLFAWGLDSI